MWEAIKVLAPIIGPSALTAIIICWGFIRYLSTRDAREEEADAKERAQLLSLLEKQTQANQQVAILNEKVALVLDKLLRNGHGDK